jgi:recombination protein RecR
MVPKSIQNLADLLKELPSIGPRQAIRLAFFVANKNNGLAGALARALLDLNLIKPCENCLRIHEKEGALCAICADPTRVSEILAIVEKETDLVSLEKSGGFKGKYFLIGELKRGGVLEENQKEKLEKLKTALKNLSGGIAEEIIIATSPTTYGDLAAATISRELDGLAKKISRLGRGIPTGGEIEFADAETLRQAIERRQ